MYVDVDVDGDGIIGLGFNRRSEGERERTDALVLMSQGRAGVKSGNRASEDYIII